MPRGGRRPGAGRKPLAFSPECWWIVDQIRDRLAKAEDGWRQAYLKSLHREAMPIILEEQAKLRKAREKAKRHKEETPQLSQMEQEDLRAQLGEVAKAVYGIETLKARLGQDEWDSDSSDEDGVPIANPRGIPILIRSRRVYGAMTRIFASVARSASRKFGQRITPRQVERCWDEWRELERIVSSSD